MENELFWAKILRRCTENLAPRTGFWTLEPSRVDQILSEGLVFSGARPVFSVHVGDDRMLGKQKRTIAGETRDQIAANAVAGHADQSMAGQYREHISDDRLLVVVNHVRSWLDPKLQKMRRERSPWRGTETDAKAKKVDCSVSGSRRAAIRLKQDSVA
ncbi:MAG: hypothetical protein HY290_04500 [Planctomycetia bacterium]|nr:hypothetical protein [Planctomycetia bacterium]